MKTLLAVRHVHFEHLGALEPLFADAGYAIRYAEAPTTRFSELEPADVLVDAMRGRWSTWTRVRVNLRHVPAELRPAQEPLDPDEKTLASS